MWWHTENEARAEIKARAIAKRMYMFGDAGGTCYCDYCGVVPGYEYHEIVSRARTVADEQVREWSFDERICSVLCQQCHSRYAPTYGGQRKLLERNIECYGRATVVKAFYRIPETFRRGIQLP